MSQANWRMVSPSIIRDSFPYITMEEQMIVEAQAYLARAASYRAAGKEAYAIGCERKARKKIRKARDLCAMKFGWPR